MTTWVSLWMLGWASVLVAATWLSPRRWQLAVMGSLSAAFLVVTAPRSAALAAVIALATFYGAAGERPSGRRVGAIVAAIAALLLWLKLGVNIDLAGELSEPLIPLGLSYYSLRAIHYLIERYKGTLEAPSLGQYVAYLVFFPMLIVGPISRFPEFQRDLRRRRWDGALFSRGCERIVHGYAKIIVLGNYLVSIRMAGWVADLAPPHSGLGHYLECLLFALNVYFQFSGFSDVAIGLGLLLGFHLMENFNAPFLAPNINEFWRRWHISLTSWCRSYIYTPVAAATRMPLAGIFLSMIVIGTWHEVSLRFIAWGLYHASGIAFWRALRRWRPSALVSSPPAAAVVHAASVVLTFNFVVVGFVFAKEPTLDRALAAFGTLFGIG